MSNQVTYVSSVKNTYKKAKLNNVIQSLNCFVSCTTPDVTQQDYGVICYCGKISKGQYIKGNRPPRKSGTPVIVSNVWLGTIDNNGNLLVENTCSSEASFVTTTQWLGDMQCSSISITFNPNGSGSSYYCCDASIVCGPYVTCTQCEDDQGEYISEVSTSCTWTPYHEKCYRGNAFPGQYQLENCSACWLWRNWFGCCVHNYMDYSKTFNTAYTCWNWCSGKLYYCFNYDVCIIESYGCSDYWSRVYLRLRSCGQFGPFAGYCCTCSECPHWVSWEDGHFLLCSCTPTNCSITFSVYCCEEDSEGYSDHGWEPSVTKTLNGQSKYCASSTGNIMILDNPYKCVQLEVCRKLREIDCEVCFCTRYY